MLFRSRRVFSEVFFDGQVLYGGSRNSVSPYLTYTNYFSTTRYLASAGVFGAGRWAGWLVAPRLEYKFYYEKVYSYQDTYMLTISPQDVVNKSMIAGMEISRMFEMPFWAVEGNYSISFKEEANWFKINDRMSAENAMPKSDRAVAVKINLKTQSQQSFSFTISRDELLNKVNSLGVSLQVRLPF